MTNALEAKVSFTQKCSFYNNFFLPKVTSFSLNQNKAIGTLTISLYQDPKCLTYFLTGLLGFSKTI